MIDNESILEKLTSIEQLLSRQGLLQKEVMTLNETSDYLDVSTSYLYKLTYTNQIPHYVPTGKKIYFKRSELDEWLLRNKQSSAEEIEKMAANYLVKKGGRNV